MKRPHRLSLFLVAASCAVAQVPGFFQTKWVEYQDLVKSSERPASSSDYPEAGADPTISLSRLRHKVPSKAMAAFSRALKLARRKQWQQGARELQEALAVDPDFSDAHENLGVHYMMLGRFSESLPELHRAIELDPSISGNHSNLALAYMLTRQRDQAKSEAETAVSLDSRNLTAQYLLGSLLAQNPAAAIDAQRRLKFAAREIPDAHLVLMRLYRRAGEDSLAQMELEQYRRAVDQPKGSLNDSGYEKGLLPAAR